MTKMERFKHRVHTESERKRAILEMFRNILCSHITNKA